MEKLLHERLRELKGTTSDELLDKWVDEIERYYIPRPRFEDGEPVQFGDETRDLKSVDRIEFKEDGFIQLTEQLEDRTSHFSLCKAGEFVKRSTPKVYDADGVAYERGQHVWHIETGEEYIVIDLPTPDSYQSIQVESVESGYKTGYDPNRLTHERPVFDADGVEIKVGDTVWSTVDTDHEPLKVKELAEDNKFKAEGSPDTFYFIANSFTHERPVFDAEGVRICKGDTVWSIDPSCRESGIVEHFNVQGHAVIRWSDGQYSNHCGNTVTHREPDSLESIAKYAKDEAVKYAGCIEPLNKVAYRLTALIERGA